ncbi:Transposase [Vibrio quintilis]|uniref:Transposase n=1 Tax=Vibrio quintilis TaxID=1117707 RepID=A0A1M7Z395_9VIBR|nr:Transposase [Vibrio quintilis]
MPFVLACAETGLPIVRANPIHIKRFAGAIGRRAKNDRLDAELIAHYAEAIKPSITIIKPENIRLISDLVIRRNQLLSMQTMEKNRIQILPKSSKIHLSIKQKTPYFRVFRVSEISLPHPSLVMSLSWVISAISKLHL